MNAFWQRALAYRFTILTYRIGEIGEVIVLILMWSAIYGEQETVAGFTLREMATYLLVGNLFNSAVRNFLADIVSHDIKNGKLSAFLVKPMEYFHFILWREVGRNTFTMVISALSNAIVILLFMNMFIWNFDIAYILVIVAMIILAFFTEFLISYIVGLVSFWTDEVDGLHTTIDRVKKFFSGGYFPISLLPAIFVNVSLALPFAYSFYVPAQLYLKKIDLSVGLQGLLVQFVWIAALYGISRIVWHFGLKRYEGVGI